MASPAQIIRHKFLNTFFSRHSIWFLCIFTALTITWFRTVYTPHKTSCESKNHLNLNFMRYQKLNRFSDSEFQRLVGVP
ncbi:hypothetical protein, partial [Acinetobacter baumannii]|uniref:hypothetical protein n=1 Tax=Acinetobacter baumannii TaxID=470 RepID=UPI000AC14985